MTRLALTVAFVVLAMGMKADDAQLLQPPLCSGNGRVVIPERHRPRKLAGRSYWTVLDAGKNAEEEKFFPGCLPMFGAERPAPPVDSDNASWRTMRELFPEGGGLWGRVEETGRSGRPFLLAPHSKRKATTLAGRIDLDGKDYRDWKAAHPGFLYFNSLDEWDWDIRLAYWFANAKKRSDDPALEKRRDEVRAFLGEEPRTKVGRVAWLGKYADRQIALHYGDAAHMSELHACLNISHLAAQKGIGFLILETTNTSGGDYEARWAVSGMFTRGAARQFKLPWMWYTAVYMNGYDHDGRWVGNSECNYTLAEEAPTHFGWRGPEGGCSRSLNRRIWYYAYLNGANAVQQEQWTTVLMGRDSATGAYRPSPRGEDFAAYNAFTKAHPDRGATYTPVAVLVPNDRGYTAYGAFPFGEDGAHPCGYTPDDETTDAVFFTLQPTFERDKAMRRGTEGNLRNSPFAMIYDAITPDANQSSAERLATFRSYRALVVTGDYADRGFERELSEYERGGGRVVRITPDDLPTRTKDAADTGADVLSGHRTYPKVAAKLKDLQDAYFPFEVTGDCLYGANRTPKGWWVWAFNNKGIVKFADAAETVVPRMRTTVKIATRKGKIRTARELVSNREAAVTDGRISHVLPPGELAIFEIRD